MAVQLEITFKSGAKITVEVESWELKDTPVRKALIWRGSADAKRTLVSFDMAEVAAIVEIRP